jgi:hypothetical protein
MLALMQAHYLGVTRERFEADLAEKERVILLREGAGPGKIVGFTTLMLIDLVVAGRAVKAVFSGDTIVERGNRNTFGLGREICRYFVRAVEENSDTELFYILIAKGWQTCRIPALLFREYSPAPDRPVNIWHQRVMDAFGAKKYPRHYRPESGLITFAEETQRVIAGSAEGDIPARGNPLVDFFLKKNPDYLRGDELVYVAPIIEANFTGVFQKLRQPVKEVHLVG